MYGFTGSKGIWKNVFIPGAAETEDMAGFLRGFGAEGRQGKRYIFYPDISAWKFYGDFRAP